MNLQIQLAIHMSQGVTGHAGYQLPMTRDPRPTYFFPLHSGVGLDFTERMEKKRKILLSREADPVSYLDRVAVRTSFSFYLVVARRLAYSTSYKPNEAPNEALPDPASDNPLEHSYFNLDASACLPVYVVYQ